MRGWGCSSPTIREKGNKRSGGRHPDMVWSRSCTHWGMVIATTWRSHPSSFSWQCCPARLAPPSATGTALAFQGSGTGGAVSRTTAMSLFPRIRCQRQVSALSLPRESPQGKHNSVNPWCCGWRSSRAHASTLGVGWGISRARGSSKNCCCNSYFLFGGGGLCQYFTGTL